MRRALSLGVRGTGFAMRKCPEHITMWTTRDAGGARFRGSWWRKIGALGVALALPGGLVLVLYLIVRSRRRTVSTLQDPYVEWLRMRDRMRSEWRPAAGVEGAMSTLHAPGGRQAGPSRLAPAQSPREASP